MSAPVASPSGRPGPATTRLQPLGFTLVLLILGLATGCASRRTGRPLPRSGDEIVVAGQLFHTGTPVVTWMDPGGYDAYRVERRFAPIEESDWKSTAATVPDVGTPNRYGLRRDGLEPADVERLRGGGWSLPELQERIDQFVIHFDACGTSRQCFKVLHDLRGLSVHFMLDVDGTIYQTLDLKERAWHATTSNGRSIGIEIAQIGAVPIAQRRRLEPWYATGSDGDVRLTFPSWLGETGIRTPGFVGRPARPDPVTGSIQGQELIQYDFTPEQYAALAKLTAALCRIFPKLAPEAPRDPDGTVTPGRLDPDALRDHRGLLGHHHVQANKVDPGPAFQWDALLRDVRRELRR